MSEPQILRVAICGPNLRIQDQGYHHVHTADCADLKHYGPRGRKYGGDEPWKIPVCSRQEIVEAIYGDHMDEAEDPNEPGLWRRYDDLYLAPCVKGLPDETPTKEA